jgi:cytochrome b6-f complex iron-sulfur subunit
MYISLAASYGTAVALALKYLYPNKKPPAVRSIFVARLSQLPDGGTRQVTDLRGVPVQVVRQGESLRALSTVCPHLGCRVRWEAADKKFVCPCHNAAFDQEGKVVAGPPPRPLDRYEVEVVEGSIYLKMKEPA